MADLRLVSTRKCQLKPLVEGALFNELRLLEAGIRRTEQRLLEFEGKYHLETQEFIFRYENDKMEETTNMTVVKTTSSSQQPLIWPLFFKK